jgi:peptidoglycan/xylan/chitin deacetylase (PgdA/CDA1 family)
MTFDDVISDSILDKFEGIPVTFFPVSKLVDKNVLARALSEGHQVGNHTSNSPNLKTLSLVEQLKEIELADSELGFVTKFLRPPYGEKNDDTYKLGKVVVMWDRNLDSEYPSEGVMLLHQENRILEVVRQARDEGLIFSSLQECVGE